MTATTTIQQASASYEALVARFSQYEAEAPKMRPVRATRRLSGKGGVKFERGDVGLGYTEASVLEPGKVDWIVYSARVGWHVRTSDRARFEYID